MTFAKTIISAALLAATGAAASAATISFDSTEFETPKFRVAIDDDTAGRLTFNVNLLAGTGDILGFGLNSSLGEFWTSDVVGVTTNNGEGLTRVFNDTSGCGNGCNFNGGDRPVFDTILRFGQQGVGAGGELTALSFGVLTDQTLANFTFSTLGIRAQATGSTTDGDGEGSVKLTEFEPVAPVPLPAAGWAMIAALGSLAALRRRRRVA